MKRRELGLLAGASAAALKLTPAKAATAPDPTLLTTTLTPFGAERAGNADGSIPAWTGGFTTVPEGWQPSQYMPDPFASEQPVVVIDSRNMAEHAANLTDGIQAMMQKFGLSIKVYPTHRTACAPQSVYDNIAKNLTTASLNPAGGRLGFQNAFGGAPFPIPDTSDPLAAGAQIMWNHNARWQGYNYIVAGPAYASNNGSVILTADQKTKSHFPYYDQNTTLETFNGIQFQQFSFIAGPATLRGEQVLVWYKTNPYSHANEAWEVLNGQGRVRKAPEIAFDTPSSFAYGSCGYDEYYVFTGSLEKYDWKFIEKKEIYIPYNTNAVFLPPVSEAFGPKFMNPDHVRWEKHRVWVVEATLHPGERNVIARRRFYVDEDTWTAMLGDGWDGNDNLFKVEMYFSILRPDVPGLVYGSTTSHDLQTGNYAWLGGPVNQQADPHYFFPQTLPASDFDPEAMAAASQY